MDLPRLRLLLELSRLGSMQEVAAELRTSTSTVSQGIAALARDVAIFAEHGYALTAIRAFDLFPMTQHIECVAVLEPVAG